MISNFHYREFSKTMAVLIVLAGCGPVCFASEGVGPKSVQEAPALPFFDGFDLREFVYGKAPGDGVVFLPLGMHTKSDRRELSNNILTGVVYHSLSVGTFINSFDDRTWYLVVMRNVFSSRSFGIDYFAGVLHGYKGNLAHVEGVPLRNSFLFTDNLNPIISANVWYEVADHLKLQATLTPLVLLGGIKYDF